MPPRTILVNASFARSLLGFRGPLLRRLVAEGHRVHASAPGLDEHVAKDLCTLGVTPHHVRLARTGQNPLTDIAYRRALRALIRKEKADLVLSYTIKPCIWGSLAAADEGVESASLITGLGYAFTDGGGLRQMIIRALAVRLWRQATAANRTVIFQNPDDRADFIAAGALAETDKAKLVNGSGVDMDHYSRATLPEAARFLMITRLIGNKGVREYAQAAMQLLREGVDAEFALAGFADEGPDSIARSELETWRAAGVKYLGPLSDVRPALAECSVYVLPSYREGTPRSVLEAMATGRPVITTDAPGCRETIVDRESGRLVAPRNVGALVDAMREVARDRDLRTRMAEAAWLRASQKYAVESVNDTMLAHLGLADSTSVRLTAS